MQSISNINSKISKNKMLIIIYKTMSDPNSDREITDEDIQLLLRHIKEERAKSNKVPTLDKPKAPQYEEIILKKEKPKKKPDYSGMTKAQQEARLKNLEKAKLVRQKNLEARKKLKEVPKQEEPKPPAQNMSTTLVNSGGTLKEGPRPNLGSTQPTRLILRF
jgi:hypothetical protein